MLLEEPKGKIGNFVMDLYEIGEGGIPCGFLVRSVGGWVGYRFWK